MGISRYNGEGYSDPTGYAALSGIRREERAAKRAYRPLVYICSPFAPHLLFPQFMDDGKPAERALAMFMNLVLLGKCEQLWVFGGTISAGMAAEIEKAEKRNMPVRYFTENCEEVCKL